MGRLVLYGVGGIVALAVALRLVLALLGTLLAITGYVLVKIVPLVLLGVFVLWLWRRWRRQPA